MTHPVYALLDRLLRRPSITPDDCGCMEIITAFLGETHAICRRMDIGDTANLWVTHGDEKPLICFAGHTDVVPPGEPNDWKFDPFRPTRHNGKLYARGAADMKSGVAAMSCALRELIAETPDHPGTLAMLLTSDEEGTAVNGIQAVLPRLRKEGITPDFAIVGEPTAHTVLGDTARNGRRGSLNLTLTIHGKQGHLAYPQQIKNPIHGLGRIIAAIKAIEWDQGDRNFAATTCQFSNLRSGTGAENVAPASATAMLNWRFNTQHTEKSIRERSERLIASIVAGLGLDAEYDWRLSGEPFLSENRQLMRALADAIEHHCARKVVFNTAGGTSDARFLAQYGAESIEFGPCNATIHQIDEHVAINDLEPMANIYRDTVANLWQVVRQE